MCRSAFNYNQEVRSIDTTQKNAKHFTVPRHTEINFRRKFLLLPPPSLLGDLNSPPPINYANEFVLRRKHISHRQLMPAFSIPFKIHLRVIERHQNTINFRGKLGKRFLKCGSARRHYNEQFFRRFNIFFVNRLHVRYQLLFVICLYALEILVLSSYFLIFKLV